MYLLVMFFFCYDPAYTEIYTLSLHDALPISVATLGTSPVVREGVTMTTLTIPTTTYADGDELPLIGFGTSSLRSEEHTSELQSRGHLVCRLLLEKKNTER